VARTCITTENDARRKLLDIHPINNTKQVVYFTHEIAAYYQFEIAYDRTENGMIKDIGATKLTTHSKVRMSKKVHSN